MRIQGMGESVVERGAHSRDPGGFQRCRLLGLPRRSGKSLDTMTMLSLDICRCAERSPGFRPAPEWRMVLRCVRVL